MSEYFRAFKDKDNKISGSAKTFKNNILMSLLLNNVKLLKYETI